MNCTRPAVPVSIHQPGHNARLSSQSINIYYFNIDSIIMAIHRGNSGENFYFSGCGISPETSWFGRMHDERPGSLASQGENVKTGAEISGEIAPVFPFSFTLVPANCFCLPVWQDWPEVTSSLPAANLRTRKRNRRAFFLEARKSIQASMIMPLQRC